jgi:hypothetical protein
VVSFLVSFPPKPSTYSCGNLELFTENKKEYPTNVTSALVSEYYRSIFGLRSVLHNLRCEETVSGNSELGRTEKVEF